MICVSFSKPTVEQFLSQHPEVKMIELRLDLMDVNEAQLRRFLSLPVDVIVTCRPNGRMTEEQRLQLLQRCLLFGSRGDIKSPCLRHCERSEAIQKNNVLIPAKAGIPQNKDVSKGIAGQARNDGIIDVSHVGARYVDVEIESGMEFISTIREFATKHNCKLIASYHNFEKTPALSELKEIAERCHVAQADIVKIACMVNDEQDVLNIKSLYSADYPLIALGMGEKGVITRIKACEWGAPFTFAAASSDAVTAPGMVGYEIVKRLINR